MDNKVKSNNYYQVDGWMVNELKLKGNELVIFAIIYGFSQDGKSKFEGSLQYLAEWTNSTKQGVIKNLKSLLEKDYIKKEEVQIANNLKACKYFYNVTLFNGIKQSLTVGIKQSLTNNNINIINQNNITSNNSIKSNTNLENNNINIIGNEEKKQKRTNKKKLKEEQEKENEVAINNLIDHFTDNPDIQQLLEQYVDIRKQRGLTSAQFMIMLDDLRKYCGENIQQQENCIRKAIAGGWSQIVFIDTFKGKAKTSYGSFDNTAGYFTGNPKISDLDFRLMTFESRKDYISKMALADMTREQREFFNKYCLAKDEKGNNLEF